MFMNKFLAGLLISGVLAAGSSGLAAGDNGNKVVSSGSGAGWKFKEMSIYASKATDADKKLRLLPDPNKLADCNAPALYKKAIVSMPANIPDKTITEWQKVPLNKFPIEPVEEFLKDYEAALKFLDKAANCRYCDWLNPLPGEVTDELMDELAGYKKLARILSLRARLKIAKRDYDGAVKSIRTGLVMGRNLSKHDTLVQGLVGVAISALIFNQVEEMISVPDGLNFYVALGRLPKPFIDVEPMLEAEMKNLDKQNFLVRGQMKKQLEPAHDRVRQIVVRLDRHIAAFQGIEALRLNAGSNNGKFAETLGEVKNPAVPVDPATKRPFEYKRTGSEAIFEHVPDKSEEPKDAMVYKLLLKE